jgi:hypothetical protein
MNARLTNGYVNRRVLVLGRNHLYNVSGLAGWLVRGLSEIVGETKQRRRGLGSNEFELASLGVLVLKCHEVNCDGLV